MAAAALVAVAVSAIGLFVFSRVHWPAFPSSNVLRAVTTVGQVATLVAVGIAVLLYRRGHLEWIARVLSWAGISGFVTVTLGLPLAATRLYLGGITADQEFRTEYLTRLTDSPALHDMTYPNLPPYYPAGWFWLGGRFANLMHMQAWAAFKPFAIISIAVAAAVALTLWTKLIRSDWALLVSVAVTAVVVAYNASEPYGAVITMLLPAVSVLAWGGFNRGTAQGGGGEHRSDEGARRAGADGAPIRTGGWTAAVGTGAFIGLAGAFYTLYFGIVVLIACAMAVTAAAVTRSWKLPLAKLFVVGGVSAIGYLLVWTPYWLKALGATLPSKGSATHFLPPQGARLLLPMFDFSVIGFLCLIGICWLFLRVGTSRRAQSLAIGVGAIYLWTLASMALTAIGSTLLSFRLEPVLIALLATAGVFGFLEGARTFTARLYNQGGMRLLAAGLAGLACLSYTQYIPTVLTSEINLAYSDTDGSGQRADKRPASASSYYGDIDYALQNLRPGARDNTVILTADTSFLSYYPYLGFQALTSHYANPLSQFAERAAAIESWSKLTSSDELLKAWNTLPWRKPDAILFRYDPSGYTLRLAEDVYPNDPNVKRYTVTFDPKLFEDPRFTVERIGPFVLVATKG